MTGNVPALPAPAPVREFTVAAYPHPFSEERIDCAFAQGVALADLLGEANALAFVDGVHVPREWWPRVRPKAGTHVLLRHIPSGGDDKGIVRLVAAITISIAAPYAAAATLGTTVGSLGPAGYALSAAYGVAGNLSVNAIIPPTTQQTPAFGGGPSARIPRLTGTSNQVRRWGNIPVVLGRHRVFPDAAIEPITESSNNDQYLRQVFCIGWGPVVIEDIRIGETPIVDPDTGEANFEGVELQIREGFPDDEPLTLAPETINEEQLGIALEDDDGFVTRTTATDTDEIGVEVAAPQGLRGFQDNGDTYSLSVEFEVQYAPTGTSDWSLGNTERSIGAQQTDALGAPLVGGGWVRETEQLWAVGMDKATGSLQWRKYSVIRAFGGIVDTLSWSDTEHPIASVTATRDLQSGQTTLNNLTDERRQRLFDVSGGSSEFVPSIDGQTVAVTGGALFQPFRLEGKSSEPVIDSIRFAVPTGQYDVRVRRITENSDSNQVVDGTQWTVLRSIRDTPPITPVEPGRGLALIGIRIKRTDQLNGALDRVNCIAHSIVDTWDNDAGEWVSAPSRNPAWLYRAVLIGSAAKEPLPAHRLSDEEIIEWGLACEADGRTFDAPIQDSTTLPTLNDLAATGRAAYGMTDQGRYSVVRDIPQATGVQTLTPRNSWDFSASFNHSAQPHALRAKYVSPETWQEDELLVYADGYDESSATRFEVMDFFGYTQKAQVRKDAAYHLRVNELRPETYELKSDWQWLAVRRGDKVDIAHDAILVSLGTGRILEAYTNDDDDCTAVMLDQPVEMIAGTDYALNVQRATGDGNVTQSVVTAPGEQQVLRFDSPVPGVQDGDLWVYGESEAVTLGALVKELRPEGELNCKLVLVPEAPGVHTEDDDPDFDDDITLPPDRESQPPPAPAITGVRSSEQVAERNTDRSLSYRLAVSYSVPSGRVSAEVVRVQARRDYENKWRTVAEEAGRGEARIGGFDPGDIVQVRAQTVSEHGVTSEWVTTDPHEIEGVTETPPAVTGLTAEGKLGSVLVTLDGFPETVGFVEVLASTSDNLNDAGVIGRSETPELSHNIGDGTGYYYWARLRDGSRTVYGPTAGPVYGEPSQQPDYVKELLDGSLTTQELEDALNERIDLIDDPAGVDGSVNQRLQDEADALQGQIDADVTDLNEEIQDRIDADDALQDEADALQSQIDADIADLDQEIQDRIDADDALDADIQSEATTRQDEDDLLARQLTVLFAAGGTDAQVIRSETEPANPDEDLYWIDESGAAPVLKQYQDGAFVEVDGYDGASLQAAIADEETARIDGDDALASDISTVQAQADDNEADITTEQTARADADDALATDISAVQAAADDNEAAILAEETARADGDSALASDLSATQADVDDNEAAIVAEETARADGDSAEASARQALSAQIRGDYEGDDLGSLTEGLIYDERETRADEDGALASDISAVQAQADDNEAAITSEETARVEGDEATARQINLVEARAEAIDLVYPPDETPSPRTQAIDNEARVVAEQEARTDADSALATDISAVQAAADDNEAAILAEETARADGDSALASDLSATQADVDDNEAAITTEQTARADADDALASDITTVQSQADDNEAAVSTNATAIGGLEAQYTVKLDNNGRVAGYGLASEPTDEGGTLSSFGINANELFVSLPSSVWQASTSYAEGEFVRPTGAGVTDGSGNVLVFRANNAGSSGSSEPTWPGSGGGTVTEGDVEWEAIVDSLLNPLVIGLVAGVPTVVISQAHIGDLTVGTRAIEDNAATETFVQNYVSSNPGDGGQEFPLFTDTGFHRFSPDIELSQIPNEEVRYLEYDLLLDCVAILDGGADLQAFSASILIGYADSSDDGIAPNEGKTIIRKVIYSESNRFNDIRRVSGRVRLKNPEDLHHLSIAVETTGDNTNFTSGSTIQIRDFNIAIDRIKR